MLLLIVMLCVFLNTHNYYYREEKFKLVQLQSSLDQLKENDYKDHLQRSERELGQIKQQIKRKIEEKNKHEQQIVEVRNVQEEMESKVEDMATYVS